MIDAILKKLSDYKADAEHVARFLIAPTRYRQDLCDPKRTWSKAFSVAGLLALITYVVVLALPGSSNEITKDQLQISLSLLALQTFSATLLISAMYWLATRRPVETRLLADTCITAWLLIFVCASILGRIGITVFEYISPPPAPSDGRLEHFLRNLGTYLLLVFIPIVIVVCAVGIRLKQHLTALFNWKASLAFSFVLLWFIASALVVAITPNEVEDALSSGLNRLKSLL